VSKSEDRANRQKNARGRTHSEPAPDAAGGAIPTWEAYWMEFATVAGKKSKDPRCQVGAVIVSDDVVRSTGYNGLARHIRDDPDLLADAGEKLKWICHAEFNAIMNAARHGIGLKDSTIYVTKFPCFACCNAIIQAGIREIYTDDYKFWDDDPFDPDHTRKVAALSQAGIKVHAPNHPHFSPKYPPASASALTEVPTTKPPRTSKSRKTSKRKNGPKSTTMHKMKKQSSSKQSGLFPARQPIHGGKSDDQT